MFPFTRASQFGLHIFDPHPCTSCASSPGLLGGGRRGSRGRGRGGRGGRGRSGRCQSPGWRLRGGGAAAVPSTTAAAGARRSDPIRLDCCWVVSLDFNFLVEIKLGFPLNPQKVQLFAGVNSNQAVCVFVVCELTDSGVEGAKAMMKVLYLGIP